jgi:hypothetical protein
VRKEGAAIEINRKAHENLKLHIQEIGHVQELGVLVHKRASYVVLNMFEPITFQITIKN